MAITDPGIADDVSRLVFGRPDPQLKPYDATGGTLS
jgi:hypothetical protein